MGSSRWATTTPATSAIGRGFLRRPGLGQDRAGRRGSREGVAIDSTKPDLDEGEVGREHYGWLDATLRGWTEGPRIVVLHLHILAVPGTGRDVNNLRDAGDVMAILCELEVDLVLSGHRHVPYVWSISGMRVVHSGTVSTLRVRGTMPPSYNVIEIDSEEVRIAMRQPGQGVQGEEPLALPPRGEGAGRSDRRVHVLVRRAGREGLRSARWRAGRSGAAGAAPLRGRRSTARREDPASTPEARSPRADRRG